MDRRVQKTKQAIYNAYYELLLESKKSKITISEIAKRANIDRKTFYLHYSSIDDIVHEFIELRVEKLLSVLHNEQLSQNPFDAEAIVNVFNALTRKDLLLFRKLAAVPAFQSFWDRIEAALAASIIEEYRDQVEVPEHVLGIYARFFSHGLFSVYTDWLRQEIPMSLEDFSKTVMEVSYYGASKLLENALPGEVGEVEVI